MNHAKRYSVLQVGNLTYLLSGCSSLLVKTLKNTVPGDVTYDSLMRKTKLDRATLHSVVNRLKRIGIVTTNRQRDAKGKLTTYVRLKAVVKLDGKIRIPKGAV